MQRSYNRNYHFFQPASRLIGAGVLAVLLLFGSCKKFLNIPLPADRIAGPDAYASDLTTSGVLNGIYQKLQNPLSGNAGLSYNAGLYADELQNINPANVANKLWYSNVITGDYGGTWWVNLYTQIAIANTTVAAMRSSALPGKNRWLGEALFLRALMYYYLVNIYGDVPLALGTDYQVNNKLSRLPQSDVYKQVVADLKEAQTLLGKDYVDFNGNTTTTSRARPNLAAATALLARVYLYLGDWQNAEDQSTTVISDPAYALEALNNVFLVNSKENIWGIVPPSNASFRVLDPQYYIFVPGSNVVTSQVNVSLSPLLVNSFETGDLRLASWVDTITIGTPAVKYYYAFKYKVKDNQTAAKETLSLLRLAELYLIRAEARAQRNNLGGAISDLNTVRTRGGLTGTGAVSQSDLLTAIAKERRVELFTEQGHRFFDLKRTGAIDAVMSNVSPQKGSNWTSYMQFWPIPTQETLTNPKLTQTPGYQQ